MLLEYCSTVRSEVRLRWCGINYLRPRVDNRQWKSSKIPQKRTRISDLIFASRSHASGRCPLSETRNRLVAGCRWSNLGTEVLDKKPQLSHVQTTLQRHSKLHCTCVVNMCSPFACLSYWNPFSGRMSHEQSLTQIWLCRICQPQASTCKSFQNTGFCFHGSSLMTLLVHCIVLCGCLSVMVQSAYLNGPKPQTPRLCLAALFENGNCGKSQDLYGNDRLYPHGSVTDAGLILIYRSTIVGLLGTVGSHYASISFPASNAQKLKETWCSKRTL